MGANGTTHSQLTNSYGSGGNSNQTHCNDKAITNKENYSHNPVHTGDSYKSCNNSSQSNSPSSPCQNHAKVTGNGTCSTCDCSTCYCGTCTNQSNCTDNYAQSGYSNQTNDTNRKKVSSCTDNSNLSYSVTATTYSAIAYYSDNVAWGRT